MYDGHSKVDKTKVLMTNGSFMVPWLYGPTDSCVRREMLNANETWPLTKTNMQRLQRNDRTKIRQICSIKPEDVSTVRSSELLAKLQLEDLDLILREREGFARLGMWSGRVVQSEQHMIYILNAGGGQGGRSKHGRN